MNVTLAIIALCMIPVDLAVENRVDVLEVNHVYGDDGQHVLSQLIGWDWNPDRRRFDVVFWRLMKLDGDSGVAPQKQWHTGEYVSQWHDGHTLRRVYAKAAWERWLQYDVEVFERGELPKEWRRELTAPEIDR